MDGGEAEVCTIQRVTPHSSSARHRLTAPAAVASLSAKARARLQSQRKLTFPAIAVAPFSLAVHTSAPEPSAAGWALIVKVSV